MSESQKQTRPSRSRAKQPAAAAATTVAKGPAIQTTQTEQDAAALKAAATVVKDLAVQTTKAEQDEEAIKAAGVQTELVNQLNPHADKSPLLSATALMSLAASHQPLSIDAAVIVGAFKAKAKSDRGFWRAGVQFHRLKETLVVVLEKETKDLPQVQPKIHEPENVVFVSTERAMRIHAEPNLVSEYVGLDEVLTLVEIQQ